MQGNDVQSDDVQGGGVQRIAVSPLGELRPRPSWCAGRSRAMREELQCGDCGRNRAGAVELRVVDVEGHRGEGSGWYGPNAGRPWRRSVLGKVACEWGKRNRGKLSTRKSSRALARQLRVGLGPRGGRGAVMARQVRRRSCEAKAAVGRDELGGDAVQPGTASSLHPCGG
jgi:hypothetical protein